MAAQATTQGEEAARNRLETPKNLRTTREFAPEPGSEDGSVWGRTAGGFIRTSCFRLAERASTTTTLSCERIPAALDSRFEPTVVHDKIQCVNQLDS